jgi:hypothetical protein
MTRRLIIGTCLLGAIGCAAGTALADPPLPHKPHQICVVLYQADNTTTAFCVDYSTVQH